MDHQNRSVDLEVIFLTETRILNTERAYKREGHALFEHFVGFLTDQFEWRMPS